MKKLLEQISEFIKIVECKVKTQEIDFISILIANNWFKSIYHLQNKIKITNEDKSTQRYALHIH
jgi:hypothetical protein